MNDSIRELFLNDMAKAILQTIGLVGISLIVKICMKAAGLRLNNLSVDDATERLGDVQNDIVRVEIQDRLWKLLVEFSAANPGFNLPARHHMVAVANHVHDDSDNMDTLLLCYQHLAEAGQQSVEFMQALSFILGM